MHQQIRGTTLYKLPMLHGHVMFRGNYITYSFYVCYLVVLCILPAQLCISHVRAMQVTCS